MEVNRLKIHLPSNLPNNMPPPQSVQSVIQHSIVCRIIVPLG